MHLLYKSIRFLELKMNVRFLNGRIYRTEYFLKSGKQILDEQGLLKPYKELIRKYPAEGNYKKAFQNLELFIEMIYRLRLHEKKELRILDIGSRAGLFPFFCKSFGHQAMASDLKDVIELSPTKEILDLLGVEVIPLKIEPFVKLPDITERFDLITGFRTRFHSLYTFETGFTSDEYWGRKEWGFFLKNVSQDYLNPGGKIYFILNRLQGRENREKYPSELRDYFSELGGNQKYNELVFDNSTLLEKYSH